MRVILLLSIYLNSTILLSFSYVLLLIQKEQEKSNGQSCHEKLQVSS